MKEVLDTRFLLTHFFSDQPRILDRARSRLRDLRRNGNGVLPTLVLTEFFDQVCRHAGAKEAAQKCEALLLSGLDIHALTPEIALAAGKIRCTNRDVPVADCIIAATSAILSGRVVSDDPHLARIRGIRVSWI